MTSLITAPRNALPSKDDPAPTLTSRELHKRLQIAVPHELVRAKVVTQADLPALRSYRDEAVRLCAPATEEQIMFHVGKLALHYPQPDLAEGANKSRWNDWFDDFADVPEDVLAAACRDWRRSPSRFAPSPGQLLELCVGFKIRRLLANRAELAISELESA